jgi:Fe-S-cluster-containing hydrogenase component 2
MANPDLAMHYVCTHEKALQLVDAHQRFWVCNCGCRESRGGCARSRLDLCLMFTPDDPGSGSGKREITRVEVQAILEEAADKLLVTRPWRNDDRSETIGICFCCDDCCGYFLDPSEKCDKGELVARTDLDACTHCSACVDVCHFHARAMSGDKLTVNAERCYGCGLCVTVCPEECIRTVSARPNEQQRWLDAYDSLPGLLGMAWQMLEATGLDLYRLQEELRTEYRRKGLPFRWSMPHRRPYDCDVCGYSNTDIEHELENPAASEATPGLRKVGVSELAVHRAREHGMSFPGDVQGFLTQFAGQEEGSAGATAAEGATQ